MAEDASFDNFTSYVRNLSNDDDVMETSRSDSSKMDEEANLLYGLEAKGNSEQSYLRGQMERNDYQSYISSTKEEDGIFGLTKFQRFDMNLTQDELNRQMGKKSIKVNHDGGEHSGGEKRTRENNGLQLPELPVEDIERILLPSPTYQQSGSEENSKQTPSFKPRSSDSFSSDNSSVISQMSSDFDPYFGDLPSHLKYGVLNINIGKMVTSDEYLHKKVESPAHSGSFRGLVTCNKMAKSDIHSLGLLSPKKEINEDVDCKVCTKRALRFSSYGGIVCSSCRSFFRRAAQNDNHLTFSCKYYGSCRMDPTSRKNCQYCRFKLCSSAGMKVTWVLSDQERERRFNKVKKETIPKLFNVPFNEMEVNKIEDLKTKLNQQWLRHFLMRDKNAACDLICFVYEEKEFKADTWECLLDSMSSDFVKIILPTFPELELLSKHDLDQVTKSENSGIALFFKHAFWIDIGDSAKVINCPAATKMREIAEDKVFVDTLEIESLLLQLDLNKTSAETRRPSYTQIYPSGWAQDREIESNHQEAMHKIVHWPLDSNNKFDPCLVCIMIFIILFNVDFYILEQKEKIEQLQLKLTLLMQRYLRSKMSIEAANSKFLEGMMLISLVRQVFDTTKTKLVKDQAL